jgi:murein L,D-transpeptidase YafK
MAIIGYFCSMKQLLAVIAVLSGITCATAQPSFIDAQMSNERVADAFKSKADTLEKQFAAEGLQWPPKQVYIRSFKYDSKMEVWVRNSSTEPYRFFKTYKICALSGALGPKRVEGDYQVPEGFYYINLFNPKSNYHLSLGLNYPNASDMLLSDSLKPGGDIYIHGNCITVGCMPIQDNQIEELYLLASEAKNAGEDFIPVHIFPVNYDNPKSMDYLDKATKEDQQYQHFVVRLKEVYDYFDQHKKLPIISVNKKGDYIIL